MQKAYISKKSIRALIVYFVTSALAGCSIATSDSTQLVEYNLGFGSDKPIHALELTLANAKNTLHSSGGGYSGGSTWDPNNPQSLPKAGGFHVLAGKQFIPKTAHARWFSYQNQKFYEADLSFAPTLTMLFKDYQHAFGKNTHEPTIIFGFGANGEIQAVLKVSCSYQYECGKNERAEKIATANGRATSGDAKAFLAITKQLIREKTLKPITGIED
ncbi:DUF2931 family protein [Pseudomonas sp. SA3-5]|uniref:DUF2931 family protein n=1 Tax=Pseudomonas aestuarii TaxID=3018340 RepID=A0ABT4XFB3_9PSED|nr:DUF2931 family protein [Pseudomonas aestuarii]MDA7086916.1 DUF2931 family protein [Pseudomonas aestuarii]